MSETERILDQLQRTFGGDAWAGPSLQATLAGLTAGQAAAHPVPGAHSIWEIVLHLETWLQVVRRRLKTLRLTGPTDEENWPPVPAEPSEEAWEQAQVQLRRAHEQLLSTVAQLSAADLHQPLATHAGYPAGTPGPAYVLLHGLAQHTCYHTGQIALLRKAGA